MDRARVFIFVCTGPSYIDGEEEEEEEKKTKWSRRSKNAYKKSKKPARIKT